MGNDSLAELTGGLFGGDSLTITSGLVSVAPHARTRIRDYVVALLRGFTLEGARVEGSRQLPVNDEELPKILVYTLNEASEKYNAGAPTTLQRVCELVVEVVAGDIGFRDKYADNVANLVEDLLMGEPSLGGNAADTFLLRTETFFSEQEAIDLVLLRMTFHVEYHTEHAVLVPNDLRQIAVNLDFAPADGRVDSEDLLEVPGKEGP